MKKRYPKAKPPNTAQQALRLKRCFPDSHYTLGCNTLTWYADLTPHPLSERYQIKLTYRLNKFPKVFVIAPELISPEGKALPHVWSDGSLCLFYSRANEWQSHMWLVETIVPWTVEWLLHYEVWHATGSWHGGGVH